MNAKSPSTTLIGHDRVVSLLQRGAIGERAMPCWIFGGPFGVGKCSAAKLLGGLLIDPETRSQDIEAFTPRADTKSGELFAAERHPDLHIITKERALESPIERVRSAKQRTIPVAVLRQQMIGGQIEDQSFDAIAYLSPSLGRRRVFIIDEAELLNASAQNLLLKTLEEPPPRSVFILVTTRPESLLPTVRSRCQPARFGTLDAASMTQWRAEHDFETHDESAVDWAMQFAAGKPGLAIAALDEGLNEWAESIAPMIETLARGGFPESMAQHMAELIENSAKKAEKRDARTSKEMAAHRAMELLVSLVGATMHRRLIDAVARGDNEAAWASAIEVTALAERQVRQNVNRKFALAGLVTGLCEALGGQTASAR